MDLAHCPALAIHDKFGQPSSSLACAFGDGGVGPLLFKRQFRILVDVNRTSSNARLCVHDMRSLTNAVRLQPGTGITFSARKAMGVCWFVVEWFAGAYAGLAFGCYLGRQVPFATSSVALYWANNACLTAAALLLPGVLTGWSSLCLFHHNTGNTATLAGVVALAMGLTANRPPRRLWQAECYQWWSLNTANPRKCENDLLYIASLMARTPSCDKYPLRLRIWFNTYDLTSAAQAALRALAPHIHVLDVNGREVIAPPVSSYAPRAPPLVKFGLKTKLMVKSAAAGRLLRQAGLSTLHVACLTVDADASACDPREFSALKKVSFADCSDPTWLARYAAATPDAPRLETLQLGYVVLGAPAGPWQGDPFHIPRRLVGNQTKLTLYGPYIVPQGKVPPPAGAVRESLPPRVAFLQTQDSTDLPTQLARLRPDVLHLEMGDLARPSFDMLPDKDCSQKPLVVIVNARVTATLASACGLRQASPHRLMRLYTTLQWNRYRQPTIMDQRDRRTLYTAVSASHVACPVSGRSFDVWQSVLVAWILADVQPQRIAWNTGCRCADASV